ncbi:MAG: GNAT family N-acetyltransferase [Bacilli bacterium]
MKYYRELLAKIKRADELFNLINDGDKIVIGISGGKDSIVLFEALMTYKQYAKKDFTLYPVILNLGFERFDASLYVEHFKARGYDLYISDARNVARILEIQKERQHLPKLPCSICSKMKKAAINEVAKSLGANKVAFAHHIDDALETLFMNMISGGRLATFQPKMHLERADITFIRPLALVDEDLIINVLNDLKLPLLEYSCPNNKKTRREDIKQLLSGLYDTYESAKKNFQLMLINDKEMNLWYDAFNTEIATGVSIVKANTTNQFRDALYIRSKVFIEEQQIAVDDEFDQDESQFVSYVLYQNQAPIATIRYKIDEKTRVATIGRIAVLKPNRGHGYGALMIQHIEKILTYKYRPLTIEIGGQHQLKDYYESLGYKVTGEPYMDANIVHYHLVKKIV